MPTLATGLKELAGVPSVDIAPPFRAPEIFSWLSHATSIAQTTRATGDYWSVHPARVTADLVSRLSHPGFLCVEIHLPTQIGALRKRKNQGGDVYLRLRPSQCAIR